MAGLGSGLGITLASIARTAASTQQQDFLYITTQDGRILRGQQLRADPGEPALILFEPNDITSDAIPDPLDLLLTQDDNVLLTQNN